MSALDCRSIDEVLTQYRRHGAGALAYDLTDVKVPMTSYISRCTRGCNALTRIANFTWVVSGDNHLEPLLWASKEFESMRSWKIPAKGKASDIMNRAKSAQGPRMRFWIGADDIIEAQVKNSKVVNEENSFKPCGVDQLLAAFHDVIAFGRACVTVFDPAVDYCCGDNPVPDLACMLLHRKDADGISELNIELIYWSSPAPDALTHDFHFASMLGQALTIGSEVSPGFVVVHNPDYKSMEFSGEIEEVPLDIEHDVKFCANSTDEFMGETFNEFKDFMMHLRMRVNENTFAQDEVSVEGIVHNLMAKVNEKLQSEVLLDMSKVAVVGAFIVHAPREELMLYSECLQEIHRSIQSQSSRQGLIKMLKEFRSPVEYRRYIDRL